MSYPNLSAKVPQDGVGNRPCAGRVCPKTMNGNDHWCDLFGGRAQDVRNQARLSAPALSNQGNPLSSYTAFPQLGLDTGAAIH